MPDGSDDVFCAACRHNRTAPDLTVSGDLPPWRRIQDSERPLVYTLQRLHLPPATKAENPAKGLASDVLADAPLGARGQRR